MISSGVGIVTGTPLGHALAERLRKDGRRVITAAPDAPAELRALRLIVVDATPEALPEVARALGDVTDGGHLLAHTVRGLCAGGVPASQVLHDQTASRRIGVLAGPLTVADLDAGRPSAAVIASRHPEVTAEFADALSTASLRVYRGRDPLGVEVASALGELITVGMGLGEALGFGETSRALVLVRAVRELGRLIQALGGDAQTASGLAGLGDFLVRTRDTASAPYQLGTRLAAGDADAKHALARMAATVRALNERARVQAHIFTGLVQLVDGRVGPRELVQNLMALPVLDE